MESRNVCLSVCVCVSVLQASKQASKRSVRSLLAQIAVIFQTVLPPLCFLIQSTPNPQPDRSSLIQSYHQDRKTSHDLICNSRQETALCPPSLFIIISKNQTSPSPSSQTGPGHVPSSFEA